MSHAGAKSGGGEEWQTQAPPRRAESPVFWLCWKGQTSFFMAACERWLFFEGRPAFVYGRGGMVPAPDDARDGGAVGASALSPSPVVRGNTGGAPDQGNPVNKEVGTAAAWRSKGVTPEKLGS